MEASPDRAILGVGAWQQEHPGSDDGNHDAVVIRGGGEGPRLTMHDGASDEKVRVGLAEDGSGLVMVEQASGDGAAFLHSRGERSGFATISKLANGSFGMTSRLGYDSDLQEGELLLLAPGENDEVPARGARLRVSEEDCSLGLEDEQGNTRVRASASVRRSELGLLDAESREVLGARVTTESIRLVFGFASGVSGRMSAWLDHLRLEILDRQDVKRFEYELDKRGHVGVILRNEKNEVVSPGKD